MKKPITKQEQRALDAAKACDEAWRTLEKNAARVLGLLADVGEVGETYDALDAFDVSLCDLKVQSFVGLVKQAIAKRK